MTYSTKLHAPHIHATHTHNINCSARPRSCTLPARCEGGIQCRGGGGRPDAADTSRTLSRRFERGLCVLCCVVCVVFLSGIHVRAISRDLGGYDQRTLFGSQCVLQGSAFMLLLCYTDHCTSLRLQNWRSTSGSVYSSRRRKNTPACERRMTDPARCLCSLIVLADEMSGEIVTSLKGAMDVEQSCEEGDRLLSTPANKNLQPQQQRREQFPHTVESWCPR